MAYTPAESRYLEAFNTQEFGPVLGDLQAPDWQTQYPNFDWAWQGGSTPMSGQNPRVTDKTTGQVLQTGAQPSSWGFWDGPGQMLMAFAGGQFGGAGDMTSSAAGGGGGGTAWGSLDAGPGAYYGDVGGGFPTNAFDPNVTGGGGSDLSYQAFQTSGGFPSMAAGTGSAVGGGLWDTFMNLPWKNIGTAINVGSGLFGLYQANQMQNLAKRSFQAQDPFGPQRGQYQDQLQRLMADPSSVTKLPGYQFGLDQGRTALQRAGAASGSGGNEAIALAQYTPQYAQNFYNDEIKRLMTLSGANIGPSTGNPLAGFGAGADIYSRALAQLGKSAAAVG